MDMVLHDITAEAGPDEHCPELRAGLEELGWQVLGRVRLGSEKQIVRHLKGYDPDLVPTLVQQELVGSTVVRDPDGTTFAFVDWFFRCPDARLMTMLDDGRLVETHQAWTSDPVQPRRMRAAGVVLDRRREQTRTSARGRSIELVDTTSAAQLVEAHRNHLTRATNASGAAPGPHRSLAQAMDLFDQQVRHSLACGRRVGRIAALLSTVTMLAMYVAALVVLTRVTGRPLAGVTYALSLALLVVVLLVSTHVTAALATRLFYVVDKPRFDGTPPRAEE